MVSQFSEPVEIEEEPAPDKYVESAKDALISLFDREPNRAYFLKQLEVKLEKAHFHWVTARATNELIRDGILRSEQLPLGAQTRVKFVFHRSYRYYKREIERLLKVVRSYSRPEIARACGEQADILFFNAFMNRGFSSCGQDTNEFQGTRWTETNHNLDFIIQRDGIAYGCEIKNTWDYMDGREMRLKVRLCQHIGTTPLFIVRYAPKTYIEEVRLAGGFTLLFVYQIYPFGQNELVRQITNILEMGADCPTAIPSGIIDRFMRWHASKLTG